MVGWGLHLNASCCACLPESPPLCRSCAQKKVSLNTFLDTLMSDPPPQCLVWLPLMHRLANVENGKTADGIFMKGGGELQQAQEDAKFPLVSPYPELANTRSDQRDSVGRHADRREAIT